jgi:hypothetical protein
VVQNHPDRPLPNLRGKLVRRLAHRIPFLSRVRASGNPGAVQVVSLRLCVSRLHVKLADDVFLLSRNGMMRQTPRY